MTLHDSNSSPRPRADRPRPDAAWVGRMHQAAWQAQRRYPGPVGELIERELRAVAEFGHRFERGALSERLVEHVLAQAEPRSDGKQP